MNKLQLLMNMCKAGVTITLNDHRNNYETVQEYLDDAYQMNGDTVDKLIMAKMIELNTVVRLQFDSDTPVGFILIHHYDIDKALDEALTYFSKSKDVPEVYKEILEKIMEEEKGIICTVAKPEETGELDNGRADLTMDSVTLIGPRLNTDDDVVNFEVYAIGLCHASVCTSLDTDSASSLLNMMHPTGIESQWVFADDEKFVDGLENGCQCPDKSTHRHYLFKC